STAPMIPLGTDLGIIRGGSPRVASLSISGILLRGRLILTLVGCATCLAGHAEAPGQTPSHVVPRAAALRGAAPTPAADPQPLAIGTLEDLALRNNPTIQAAEALVQQQWALLRQVGRYPNPTVGWVQTTPSRRSEGATSGAFIGQDFVTAGKLKLAKDAERVEVDWRLWQLKAQRARVV